MALASVVLGVIAIPTAGLLLMGGVAGLVLGIVALARADREPHRYGGRGMAIAGIATSTLSLLIGLPMMIVLAITLPSLLPSRGFTNEPATIADVRAFAAAEAVFFETSGGFYGPPECLAMPEQCLPEHSGVPFLDQPPLLTRNGYRRTFHAGPPASALAAAPGSPFSTGGLENFAFTAVPLTPNLGKRSFCTDASGRLCAAARGEIDVSSGACPPPPQCADL
jgi:hypothetical protein